MMFNKTVFSSVGVVLTVALSACVTPLPRPTGLTRAPEPLAAPNNHANATDNSPPNRNVATIKPSTLQKPSIAPIVAQVPKNGGGGVLTVGGQPDWTKLFKSWENACTNSPEFEAFEAAFTVYDEKLFRSKLARVNLPAIYKAATGIPTTKVGSTGDYSDFILPVTSGTYYGISVKAIQVYRGHENGITGKQLFLNGSLKDVKQALKSQKVSFKKRGEYQVLVSGDAKVTSLICDHSN